MAGLQMASLLPWKQPHPKEDRSLRVQWWRRKAFRDVARVCGSEARREALLSRPWWHLGSVGCQGRTGLGGHFVPPASFGGCLALIGRHVSVWSGAWAFQMLGSRLAGIGGRNRLSPDLLSPIKSPCFSEFLPGPFQTATFA